MLILTPSFSGMCLFAQPRSCDYGKKK